ncbi:GNAT family N-acetyltransferase [Pseudoclavibacter alba]|uniref:GNAT family N-acetyltransferase n=1 Tax=Pseudoclavibacter albus TaxID=272241 RepID=A0ABT2HUD5_9MICO|nr:GNAT family N-acetyltransferase [Pseudoclavibacter alba]MCT2041933.1 GNAT family N-acetyltransferase [Pseudoclavibacter alba]
MQSSIRELKPPMPGSSRDGTDSLTLAVTEAGELAGACLVFLDAERHLIRALAVAVDWKRHGVGRQLVQYELDRAVPGVPVVARIDERNTASIHLFSSLGFERLGRHDPEPSLTLWVREA